MTDITENEVYRVLSYIKWKNIDLIKSDLRERKSITIENSVIDIVSGHINSLEKQGFVESRYIGLSDENQEKQYRLKNKVFKE